MPLFAFISGYVSYNSNSYGLKDFIRKRSIQILLPAFSWSFIVLITTITLNRPEHYMGVIKSNFLYYAWFLKCIWVCSIITFICKKYLKTTFAFITLSFICLLLGCLQDLGNLFWVSFLLPVYFLGIFINILLTRWRCVNIMLILSGTIYIVIYFLYWNTDLLIYTNPISFISNNGSFDLHNIFISSIRWILGITASIFMTLIIRKIEPLIPIKLQKEMSSIGKSTLGIYLIHIIILDTIRFYNRSILIINNNLFIIIFSVCLTYITYIITIIIQKNYHLGLILLGKQRKG